MKRDYFYFIFLFGFFTMCSMCKNQDNPIQVENKNNLKTIKEKKRKIDEIETKIKTVEIKDEEKKQLKEEVEQLEKEIEKLEKTQETQQKTKKKPQGIEKENPPDFTPSQEKGDQKDKKTQQKTKKKPQGQDGLKEKLIPFNKGNLAIFSPEEGLQVEKDLNVINTELDKISREMNDSKSLEDLKQQSIKDIEIELDKVMRELNDISLENNIDLNSIFDYYNNQNSTKHPLSNNPGLSNEKFNELFSLTQKHDLLNKLKNNLQDWFNELIESNEVLKKYKDGATIIADFINKNTDISLRNNDINSESSGDDNSLQVISLEDRRELKRSIMHITHVASQSLDLTMNRSKPVYFDLNKTSKAISNAINNPRMFSQIAKYELGDLRNIIDDLNVTIYNSIAIPFAITAIKSFRRILPSRLNSTSIGQLSQIFNTPKQITDK